MVAAPRRIRSAFGRPFLLTAALLVVLSSGSSLGQESSFSEIVKVDLVEVDALVVDADGHPILDLTIDDFRLFDGGEQVAITHFAPPDGGPAPVSASAGAARAPENPSGSPAPEDTPPRLVIFLDEVHLTLRSRHLAFFRLNDVLANELPAQTEILLATYTGSVDVLLPFTTNRKVLVKLLEERFSSAAQATADRVQAESLMRQLPRTIESMLAPPDAMEKGCSNAGAVVRGHSSQVLSGVQATVAALGQFVRSLSAYEGPKSLLYVSDGVPMVAGQEVWDYLIELCDGSLTGFSADPELRVLASQEPARDFPSRARLEMLEFSTRDLWSELAAEANTRRVTLNSVQASGLEPSRQSTVDGPRTSSATQAFGQRNRQEPLVVMAQETGGRAILNTNNVAPAVERLIDLDSARYIVAFASSRPADGKTHQLRLEVSRPDVVVRYRRSYKTRSDDERVADGVLASLHHGFEDNTHRLRVDAKRLDERKVALDVHIPLRSLVMLPEGDQTRGLFTLFIAALDASGLGTGIREKSVPVQFGSNENRKSHTVSTVLELKKSREYIVAVAVRDELGATTSFVRTRVRAE